MDYKDYYKIIGVGRDAKQDEIKRAYRKLARKYHPDVSKEKDAEEKFKEVGEAYEVLKDPEKRAAYDQLGSNWKQGQEFHPPPNWDAGFEFSGGNANDNESFTSDFFENLFGRAAAGSSSNYRSYTDAHSRGQDHHAKILIDISDSYTGVMRDIVLKSPEIDVNGRLVNKQRTLNVKIPKGVTRGQKIRLSGQGSKGMGGGPSGDLYLDIEFNSHPVFRVEGKDIYMQLPVAPWEAALGATVTTPTPVSKLQLKIPPRSSGGDKLRLKGQGIPAATPGDLFVLLEVAVPHADSDDEKSVYRKMEQTFKFNPRKALGV
jgi:curved DNA-binding protein